ncbi:M1 family metallopeptidase [Paenibacillus glufosinatiresistens]|uniref:M1 family metallopeptidase n=1 Tax=Paenibacillus glufosinatiresistens TaxID=3070657 RepID=UPI00286EAC4A|nr:M1 family metallopeptidase [Paenibacillus sp. YX.27]
MKRRSIRTVFLSAALSALCLAAGGWGWHLSAVQKAVDTASSAAAPAPAVPDIPKSAKSPASLTAADSGSVLPPVSTPSPVQALSRRVTEYHLNARLNAAADTITATETVTWTHPGSRPVRDLYFHLYPNAFASSETTFMKESGGRLRSDAMPEGGYGSMTLLDVHTPDGVSLTHRVQVVQPDDGNAKDRTLVRIHLPQPVAAGQSVTLNLRYELKLPAIFARMGSDGRFVMAGQWFPKLSVYEPAGTRGRLEEGWNLHQYHGNSEFYSDFGIYNVAITVPQTYTVAATGFPVRTPAISKGEKTYQFYADDVHDFAWAASPDFVVADKAFSSPGVPGVRIKLYLDPLHKGLKERYFQAAEAALANFSKWYGSYPYTTLSIVVPPSNGNGAGGMEYPTLVTAWAAQEAAPDTSLERTVIHEIGHQYFYGMVASNEFEEPWLDEAFTSYAEDKLMEQEYGETPNLALQASLVTKPKPMDLEAWKYGGSSGYTQNVYIRGKLLLKDMEREMGTAKMDAVLSAYARKYRFRHPSTADFQKTVEKVTGSSWQAYFDRYVYSGGVPDFAVDRIRIVREPAKGASVLYRSEVTLSNAGSLYGRVKVRFTFADGRSILKDWDGYSRGTVFKLTYPSPLLSAEIDPEHEILLENAHVNNFRRAELPAASVSRWTMGVAQGIEALLGILSW